MNPINYNIPLHNQCNANIKPATSDPQKLIKYGFTNRVKSKFYYTRQLISTISLDITIIPKNNSIQIDIFDNVFLQPYDYQKMLQYDSHPKIAEKVHELVQVEMKKLINTGIITGYTPGDYI